MRVLPIKDIPSELWDGKKLRITNELIDSYRAKLDELGVLHKAIEGNPSAKAIHGGISDEETIDHFVYRFPASSGRVEFASLSPCDDLEIISDALMSTFACGDVSVLDIPGGTGAATCSLLTTLAVLRENGVIPVLPLTVRIMAGDLSPKALEIYEGMVCDILDYLQGNGILVEFKSMSWDATRNDHTAAIIDEWFAMSKSDSEFVVCISNFTGALIDSKLFDSFTPSLNQILARLHNKKSTLLWVEPGSGSTNKLAKMLGTYFSTFVKWLKISGGEGGALKADYSMVNPLNDFKHPSSVHVQKFERK